MPQELLWDLHLNGGKLRLLISCFLQAFIIFTLGSSITSTTLTNSQLAVQNIDWTHWTTTIGSYYCTSTLPRRNPWFWITIWNTLSGSQPQLIGPQGLVLFGLCVSWKANCFILWLLRKFLTCTLLISTAAFQWLSLQHLLQCLHWSLL